MKHIRTAVLFIFLYVLTVSCRKSFLEVVPLGNQVASTTSDYDLLMNSTDLYYYPYAGGWQVPMLMGDEIAAEAPYLGTVGSVQMPRLFQWRDTIYQPGDNPFELNLGLSNLYVYNKVINEVMASAGGSDQQKKALQAEAMANRAWLYFQFINFYAKPYAASTASKDPGFPIITKADVTMSNLTRNSNQEVYDFIIKDLTTAIGLLPVQNTVQTRMSRAAAEGILGKVYLFMGRSSDALPFLASSLSDVAASTLGVHLYDYNTTLAPGGSFLPVSSYNGPNSPGNNANDFTESVVARIFYNGSWGGNMYGNNGVVLAPQTAALYGPTDLRLQWYTNTNSDGSLNPGGRLRKYGVTYSRSGLQLPELYLLSAECKARTNDLAGAKADVETLRKNRMPVADAAVPAAIAVNQGALIKFIIDERIREFAAEGYRWFDMRRLSMDPLFTGQVFTHTLYNDDASNTTTIYTLRQPDRLTLQIPPLYMNANPGMQNNP